MPENRAVLHELLQSIIKEGPTGEEPTFPLAGHAWEPTIDVYRAHGQSFGDEFGPVAIRQRI